MPAALIASIFGMNFKEMPLIDSPIGFQIALATMLAAAGIMTVVFWRRLRR